jgi:hypothetical protein
VKVLLENRKAIFGIVRESFTNWRGSAAEGVRLEFDAGVGREAIPAAGSGPETGTVGLSVAASTHLT